MSDERAALTERLLGFLTEAGIAWREGEVAAGSFLPGLRLEGGVLIVDRGRLQWPGDLLHEAGHVATTPAALRGQLSDQIDDDPAVPHRGEAEATAWAWAALCHLGLPPDVLFHEGGYHGHSPGLALTFQLGVYPGSQGLAQAGLCTLGPGGYPQLQRWLRD